MEAAGEGEGAGKEGEVVLGQLSVVTDGDKRDKEPRATDNGQRTINRRPNVSLVEELVETVKHLPHDKQLQVREFIVQLQGNADADSVQRPFKSFLGALEHLGCDISEEDIAEARREMWGNFPRHVEL